MYLRFIGGQQVVMELQLLVLCAPPPPPPFFHYVQKLFKEEWDKRNTTSAVTSAPAPMDTASALPPSVGSGPLVAAPTAGNGGASDDGDAALAPTPGAGAGGDVGTGDDAGGDTAGAGASAGAGAAVSPPAPAPASPPASSPAASPAALPVPASPPAPAPVPASPPAAAGAGAGPIQPVAAAPFVMPVEVSLAPVHTSCPLATSHSRSCMCAQYIKGGFVQIAGGETEQSLCRNCGQLIGPYKASNSARKSARQEHHYKAQRKKAKGCTHPDAPLRPPRVQ